MNLFIDTSEIISGHCPATPVFPCAQFDGDGRFTKPAVSQQRLDSQVLELQITHVFLAVPMLMPLSASTPIGSIIQPDPGETQVQDSIASLSARVPFASIARTIAPKRLKIGVN